MLTLDVRNAFNSAPWDAIVEAAESREVPSGLLGILKDYLSDHAVLVSSPSGFTHSMSCGVPQGSVLGTDLWNLLYDGLLRTRMPEGVHLLALADDVSVLATHQIPFVLEEKLEEAYRIIEGWMSEKLAAIHKRSQLRVACGYRTVSYKAAEVISGIPPISLLAKERAEI